MGENNLTIGGFNISGIVVAIGIPVLSAVGGAVWYAADVLGRFLDVEDAITAVLEVEGRVQAVEQTVSSNGVEQLGPTLSSISTQMTTILEQQATLLNMRSQVEKASLITDGLGTRLDSIEKQMDEVWEAYDAFYKEYKENPIR